MKSILRYSIVSFTMIGLLSSCILTRKYKRTDLHLPGSYRTTMGVAADTVLLPWRTFFTEPQLVQLIDQALLKNNDISIALKNLEQLDLSFRQAKLSLLPVLDFNAGASRSWQSKNSLNGSLAEQFVGSTHIDDYSSALRLSWEIDIWGKARMQKQAALAAYFGQRENLAALKTRILVQVAQAYYTLLSLDEQLKIARQNSALSDSTYQMMQLQFNAGQVTSLAIGQAKAQKLTAELLIPLATQNITIQEDALSILCGKYPDAITRTTSMSGLLTSVPFNEGVPALLISRRPDVKAAEYAVMVANSRAGLANAAMYPTFSITPQMGTNSLKVNEWFSIPGSITKTLAFNMTQPLFQRRALRTAYQTAIIEQEKTVIQFKQKVLGAVGEVTDAMAKRKGASDRFQLAQEKRNILAKATMDASKLYRSGMATYLEVITAQNNKLQNDLETTNIRLDQLNAVTDLYRALGGFVE